MTGKERAVFRAQANSLEPEFQIGKGGISDGVIAQTNDAFKTKELIKIKVLLDSAPGSPREFANELAEKTGCEVIQIIGGVMVLYKENKELHEETKKKPAKKTKPLANVRAKRAAAAKKEAEMKKQKRDFYAKKRKTGK